MANLTGQRVAIIGFGRFGQVLTQLLQDDFELVIYDPHSEQTHPALSNDIEQVFTAAHIFIAVPIRHFKSTVEKISPQIHPDTTIIDLCSVKVHPTQVMQQSLPSTTTIIASHPLFGPDSVRSNQTLKWMIHFAQGNQAIYDSWKTYFANKSFSMIEMTPEQHDQQVAMSQGITHFLGRVLQQADVSATEVDTLGFQSLLQLMQQTCNDTWELFCDLQNYNPYSPQMIETLSDAFTSVKQQLTDAQEPHYETENPDH